MQKAIFYLMAILVIALFSVFAVESVIAADYSEEVTVYWDWAGPTPEDSGLDSANPIANDLEWHLYMRGEGEDYPASPIAAASYDGTLLLTDAVVITGNHEQTVRKYFVLRAFYDGSESGNSNEVTKDFVIPGRAIPLNLRFTVELQGQ